MPFTDPFVANPFPFSIAATLPASNTLYDLTYSLVSGVYTISWSGGGTLNLDFYNGTTLVISASGTSPLTVNLAQSVTITKVWCTVAPISLIISLSGLAVAPVSGTVYMYSASTTVSLVGDFYGVIVGGGGGGGISSAGNSGGGGGSGGITTLGRISLTGFTVLTVGSAGVGGSGGIAATAGGTTTFGAFAASGGGPGMGWSPGGAGGAPGTFGGAGGSAGAVGIASSSAVTVTGFPFCTFGTTGGGGGTPAAGSGIGTGGTPGVAATGIGAGGGPALGAGTNGGNGTPGGLILIG